MHNVDNFYYFWRHCIQWTRITWHHDLSVGNGPLQTAGWHNKTIFSTNGKRPESDWIYILLLANAFSNLETYLAPFWINFWAARDSHFPGCFPGSVLLVLSSSFCLPDTAISNNINCQLIYFWSAAPVSNYPCEMVYASEKVFLVVYPLI